MSAHHTPGPFWSDADTRAVLEACGTEIWETMRTWGDPDVCSVRRFCYRRQRMVNDKDKSIVTYSMREAAIAKAAGAAS